MSKKRVWQALQVGIAALIIGVYLWLSNSEQPRVEMNGTLVEKPVAAFRLSDFDGNPITNGFLMGKWTLLFFGYTQCPDVCPTTLAFLRDEYAALLENRKFAQVLMISVDPERDTAEHLKAYVQAFHPEFHAATGEHGVLKKLVGQFDGFYRREKSSSTLGYLVSHPGDIFVISPTGEWHTVLRPPFAKGAITSDLRHLILRTQS